MTQNEKELLLKDLCARLPYGICVEHINGFRGTLHDLTVYFTYNDDDTIKDYMCYTDFFGDESCKIEFFKPYLFPLSSMTEEQQFEYHNNCDIGLTEWGNELYYDCAESFDWLNAHHFDYRGLIEQGLAIDATGLNIY